MNSVIKTKSKNSLQTLTFPNLSSVAGIRHAVFTRHGGSSQSPYDSLNLSFGVGDDKSAVLENRRTVSKSLQASVLVFAHQVHGRKILTIEKVPKTGRDPVFVTVGTGDALITNLTDVFLVIQTADCQAVMMVDPKKKVVANAHVGWQGNVQNIIGETISEMTHRFGCNPADLKVGIGPSLGPCCAEFINYRTEIPQAFWHYKDQNNHIDLWAISSHQLAAAGVMKENLFVSRVCTKCHADTFFSYRAQQITGRFASAIVLGQSF